MILDNVVWERLLRLRQFPKTANFSRKRSAKVSTQFLFLKNTRLGLLLFTA